MTNTIEHQGIIVSIDNNIAHVRIEQTSACASCHVKSMCGASEKAEKIIEKAKENDVPLYKDNKLADTLSKLKIGDAIPPELYEVVAEILVFVDDMDRLKAKLDGKKK